MRNGLSHSHELSRFFVFFIHIIPVFNEHGQAKQGRLPLVRHPHPRQTGEEACRHARRSAGGDEEHTGSVLSDTYYGECEQEREHRAGAVVFGNSLCACHP